MKNHGPKCELLKASDAVLIEGFVCSCPETTCQHEYVFNRACGAKVCTMCDDHKGLARCFCGWSRSGGDGRRELEDLDERIDPED